MVQARIMQTAELVRAREPFGEMRVILAKLRTQKNIYWSQLSYQMLMPYPATHNQVLIL